MMGKMHKQKAIKIGLGLIAVSFILVLGIEFVSVAVGSSSVLVILLTGGVLGLAGFLFLIASTFIPRGKQERPTFTEELLGRERAQYGVFTEGNWMTTLDQKSKEEERRRRKNS